MLKGKWDMRLKERETQEAITMYIDANTVITAAPATSFVSGSASTCSSLSAATACGKALRKFATFCGSGS